MDFFQTFFMPQTFFITHIKDLHNKGSVCFEKSLREIYSFAPSFTCNIQRANLRHTSGTLLKFMVSNQ